MELNSADRQKIEFDVGMEADRLNRMINPSDPFRSVYLSMITPNRPAFAEEFLAIRDVQMDEANAIAKAFRDNTRRMQRFPTTAELRKSGALPLMKANLDVGTLTNFAQITGGQSLGYVSLDTQMARGTVRPNSFTLYQALHKTRAFQVVDYWAQATDTGGAPPGAAFASYGSVSTGSLTTNAGKYQLQNITLKLMTDGRAITTALAAQNSFIDIAQQENINAALSVLQTSNWAAYWGNPTLFPNQFLGISSQIANYNSGANIVDYQGWYNSYATGQGWSPQQALFNLIYQWAGFITNYNQFGRITHAFMSPTAAGSLQGLVTTVLNNIVAGFRQNPGAEPVIVNGDLQGMRTRFGEIQFPIDMFITARDVPVQAVIQGDGTNQATTSAPTKPASVTVTASGGAATGSAWTSAYTASSGKYVYAVASCDSSMNESQLTWATQVSGVTVGGAYSVAIAGPTAADAAVFRVFRSGLGETTQTNPAAVRYVGSIAASGSGTVTFVDLNTQIPGSETIFLLDMDELDNAIDWRYLLPLTKIELFAQNLFMPWAVAAIGGVRLKIPKFHGYIKNYVGDNPIFNPLASNTNALF
jgi:hypothetical protein